MSTLQDRADGCIGALINLKTLMVCSTLPMLASRQPL
jgi:hypothetical protein